MITVQNLNMETVNARRRISRGLTYVDFLPKCIKIANIFAKPDFETFDALVEHANDWLRDNPTFRIKTCESVEFRITNWGSIEEDYDKSFFVERDEYKVWYIRGLRLWLVRTCNEENPEQFGYINLVPREIERESTFALPKYEKLGELLHRFNQHIDFPRIYGKILTVESQEMKVPSYSKLNPDKSFWTETKERVRQYIFVIRIFYERGDPRDDKIGIMDFLPACLREGSSFALPVHEPLTNVIERASKWCSKKKYRFLNFQSLEIKMKNGIINTQKVDYTEKGLKTATFARIIRVAYVKMSNDASNSESIPSNITCKLFFPLKLGKNLFFPSFEPMFRTKERMEEWINATGARVISAETELVRLHLTFQVICRFAEFFFLNVNYSEESQFFFFVITVLPYIFHFNSYPL